MFNTCCHMIFCSVLVKTSDNYYFLCTLLWFSQCCFLQFSVVAFFKRSLLVLPFMAVSVSVFKASPRPPSLSPPCQSKKKKKKKFFAFIVRTPLPVHLLAVFGHFSFAHSAFCFMRPRRRRDATRRVAITDRFCSS